jgi:hypothetical protein
MTNGEGRVERRKHKRFQAAGGAHVIVKPFGGKVGQLIDIGMDGLTFDYIAGEEPSNPQVELDIVMTDSAFCLRNVPCETISDFETEKVPFTALTIRRCGVQFGELSPYQKAQLEKFIQNHTTIEA